MGAWRGGRLLGRGGMAGRAAVPGPAPGPGRPAGAGRLRFPVGACDTVDTGGVGRTSMGRRGGAGGA